MFIILFLKIISLKNYSKICWVSSTDKYNNWHMIQAPRNSGGFHDHMGPDAEHLTYLERRLWGAGSPHQVRRTGNLTLRHLLLAQCFSNCGPWTRSISITEGFRTINSQAPLQTYQIRYSEVGFSNLCFNKFHGDSEAYWSLGTSDLEDARNLLGNSQMPITGNHAYPN